MKTFGPLLLALGVALAAVAGARNPASVHEQNIRQGILALHESPPADLAEALPEPSPTERLKEWSRQSGLPFGVGLIMIIAGALMSRRAARQEGEAQDSAGSSAGTGGTGAAVDFGVLLQTTLQSLQALKVPLEAAAGKAQADAVRDQVETLQRENMDRLIAARTGLERRLGLSGFVAVFGPLSSGERYLNRTWSALADQHLPEALQSLEKAVHNLEDAQAELQRQTAA